MSWLDRIAPAQMRRVAVVAPEQTLRPVLALLAEAGLVELGPADGSQAGRYDELGPAEQLDAYAATAVRRTGAAAVAGWIPARDLAPLAGQLAAAGGALVPLAIPAGVEPPTLAPPGAAEPLVQTYGTVPYPDLDPSWLAWGSYVLMFGMMFGDVGEGALLVLAAVALRASMLRQWRAAWPFLAGAGVASMAAGLLYGECFGPTGLVPVLWLSPLDHPLTLLAAAAGIGAVLLAGAYALGVVNRWREGGPAAALYAPSGIAGSFLFAGAALAAGGWRYASGPLLAGGAAVAGCGLALAFAGLLASGGVLQAIVELADLVIRLGSNLVSFTRLAAFGLTHAALSLLVWDGTRALWHRGGLLAALACLVFAAGTSLAFGLEALIAAIQALRLEYYELFSRIFVTQGRLFRPWHEPGLASLAGVNDAMPADRPMPPKELT